MLTQALAIDPDYAEAWAELSVTITNQAGQGHIEQADGFSRAEAAARRALEIDPEHARAMSGLGWNAMYRDWDMEEAARLIGNAIEVEPGNPSVINAYGVMIGVFGRRDEQIALYESALERDPVAMSVLWNLSGAYLSAGRFDDAAAIVDRMRAASPESSFVILAQSFLHWFRGETEAALDGFTTAGGPVGDLGRALALYDLGEDSELEETLSTMQEGDENAAIMAIIYAHMGRADDAFDWLERAYEARDDEMIEIRMYVGLDPLHDDPRWAGVVDAVGSYTLANACAQTRYGGAVAACGLAQGADLPATVMPFILRGVSLLGIDSVMAPKPPRLAAWQRLARDLDPGSLETIAADIALADAIGVASDLMEGKVRGRVVVDVNR